MLKISRNNIEVLSSTHPSTNDKIIMIKQSTRNSTLKEEILESGYMNMKQWMIHLHKAEQYMQSGKVKSMINTSAYNHPINNRIFTALITMEHILCIILYCDTNELQCDFSATFRRKHKYETNDELKKRHQNYYHFAKGIVEAVHIWGVNGIKPGYYNSDKPYEEGPFYCGLNRILNVAGQSDVLFAAPLSTTKNIEIAINFAQRGGMIMEISNTVDSSQGHNVNMFDCSWISRYPEENERLFVANQYKLRIKSIKIIDDGQSVESFLMAIRLLSCFINGQWPEFWKRRTLKFLFLLLRKKLRSSGTNKTSNKYIWDNLELYLSQRIDIELDLEILYYYKVPLLFYDLHPNNDNGDIASKKPMQRVQKLAAAETESKEEESKDTEYRENWSTRTDFSGVSFIGYKRNDNTIIRLQCIKQNKAKNKLMVRCIGDHGNQYKWLDIPNKRISDPDRKIITINKYDEEIKKTKIHKYYNEYMDDFNGLNVLHLNVFKLFRNVKHIVIDVGDYGLYKFDLLSLLSVIIRSQKRNVTYKVKAKRGLEDKNTWSTHCITASVSSAYEEQGWCIEQEDIDVINIEPLVLE